jgi:competence protein ComEC
MTSIFHRIPFLRLLIALATGILLGTVLETGVFYLILVLSGISVFLILLNFFYDYELSFTFGLLVHIALIICGILFFNFYNRKPEFFIEGKFLAIVTEKMVEKPNSFQTVLEIRAFSNNDSVYNTKEKIIALFEKNDQSKSLFPGQTICFEGSPQTIRNNGNPFEFDYAGYMFRQRIYRQVFIPVESWNSSKARIPHSFIIFAENIRIFFLEIYEKGDFDDNSLSILSALTLGYKKGLDPEIKRIFASAGVMHVLAVSGLHTGIVFLIVSFLFGFIKKKRFGTFAFVLLVITILWGFAFITGLSPSVKRSATMFSFLIIGQNLRRQTNTYNMLAASAFFLLLLNPNILFEAGFQLSYAAVFGIVFLQPRLEKILIVQTKFLQYFWVLFTVSVAAQIATFPLIVFYFNQVPLYFWISNLVIIPAVTILIPLGLFMLAFSWIPLIFSILSFFTGLILKNLVIFLEFIESLPASVIKMYFSGIEIFVLAGIMIFMFWFIEMKQKWQFKGIVIMMAILLLLSSGNKIFQPQKEIIVYNYAQQPVVHLIAGEYNYIVSEEILPQNNMIHVLIDNTVVHLKLRSPVYLTRLDHYEDSNLLLQEGYLFFHDRLLILNPKDKQDPAPYSSYILVRQSDKYEGWVKICTTNQGPGNEVINQYYLNRNGSYREKLRL